MESKRTVRRDGDRYELLGELASGGMATVYLARMRRPLGFSRLVAIKCMHPQFAKDPEFSTMFVDEARLTAGLRHPNIVSTVDIVADDGHLLLVMEYVEGASVAALLRANTAAKSRIPVGVAAAVVHDLLLGLHAAHEATDDDGAPLAIVHRDVSPQNVIVGVDGMARVLDFGVAKARHNVHHSASNEIKGKIPYMPPEQLCGEALDRRVDVYAAGVILWEMLTGKRLFEGASETVVARRVLDDVVVPPSARIEGISTELDRVVMKALAREASDRFATALEMAEELSRAVTAASRTEVAAWVKALGPVSMKPVSSSALPVAAASAPAPVEPPTEVTTIVAVLERATEARESEAPPARPRKRLAFGAVATACVFAAVLLAKAATTERPASAATTAARAPAAVETTSIATPPPAPAPSPAVVVAPDAATPAKTRVAKTTAKRAAPSAEPAPSTSAAPAAPSDAKGATCRPPYTVDADGHRHYKVECI